MIFLLYYQYIKYLLTFDGEFYLLKIRYIRYIIA
jgi:hypothetical protein